MSDMGKNVVLWLVILAVLLTVFSNFNVDSQNPPVKYSEFLRSVEQGQVNEVTIQGNRIYATDRTGSRYTVTDLKTTQGSLANSEIVVLTFNSSKRRDRASGHSCYMSFPILIILAVAMFFMRQMQGGSGGRGGPMSFGRSKAKLLSEDQIQTTFADVAGVDEAKEDVQELVEFCEILASSSAWVGAWRINGRTAWDGKNTIG